MKGILIYVIVPYEARQNYVKHFVHFLAMEFQEKNVFEIYWPLQTI